MIPKRILFTVTNDLSYDQRMQRICASLADAGYAVELIGRKRGVSIPLIASDYRQIRLFCFFEKGFLFYAEYNLRLFFYLLFQKADAICAIDLDTILPVYLVSLLTGCKRIYDAHELFTEQKEVISRPAVHGFWLAVEKFAVPRFTAGYTVNQSLAQEFKKRYSVSYTVIRNLPRLHAWPEADPGRERFILYQGAVNEGRCFETLIPAMHWVDAPLIICGKGNFYEQTRALIQQYGLEKKIILKGYLPPQELATLTPQAWIGLTLFENKGMNQLHSLGNRFFDYMMAGVPQVCVAYPEYIAINNEHSFAWMIQDTAPETIAAALNHLLQNDVIHKGLQENCQTTRGLLNWEAESPLLIHFYNQLFSG
jgi:glycosyltransferase involved in cell wall biosynthesis